MDAKSKMFWVYQIGPNFPLPKYSWKYLFISEQFVFKQNVIGNILISANSFAQRCKT